MVVYSGQGEFRMVSTKLPLLRLHHARMVGVDTASKRHCLRLARAIREDGVGLGVEELSPGGGGASGCGIDLVERRMVQTVLAPT